MIEVGKIVEGRLRGGVFARGKFPGLLRGCQAQVVRFNAASFVEVAGICVNGDEEVRVGGIGDGGAIFQRNVPVVLARVDYFRTGNVFFNELTQPQRHIETEIFFKETVRSFCAGVVASMPGIDGDAADLQTQFPRE